MADPVGQPRDALAPREGLPPRDARAPGDTRALMREVEAHVETFEFFAALRRVECAFPATPRLGKSTRSADDPVRLGQVPSLTFAPSMFVEAERRADGRLWLGGVFFGLFGPNGPLPLHLTEYAHDRRHNFRDRTIAGFADLFHHRMLCLFYRGWADAQPTVHNDRPASDRFRMYVGALAGTGQRTLRDRDAMPDFAKLFHAGRLSAQVKNPEGLKAVLNDFFGERVGISEFRGEWLRLRAEDELHLGRARGAGTLGVSATLGESVWGAQSRFRIMVGSMPYAAFERFLPGSRALAQLSAIVRNFVGFELDWDLQLILDRDQVPGTRLGSGTRLGWSSWLGEPRRVRDADDVVLTAKA
jgi:type VI secretion system protein ImpH